MVKVVKPQAVDFGGAEKSQDEIVDPFLSETSGMVAWLQAHQKVVAVALGLLIVGPAAAIGVQNFVESQNQERTLGYIRALKVLDAAIDSTLTAPKTEPGKEVPSAFPTEEARRKALIERLDTYGQGARETPLGRFTQAQLGVFKLNAGDADGAIAALDKAWADPELRAKFGAGLLENLGYAYELKGDFARAATYYDQLAGFGFRQEYGMYHKARVLALQGKTDEARQAFKKVIDEYPASSVKGDADKYLRRL